MVEANPATGRVTQKRIDESVVHTEDDKYMVYEETSSIQYLFIHQIWSGVNAINTYLCLIINICVVGDF